MRPRAEEESVLVQRDRSLLLEGTGSISCDLTFWPTVLEGCSRSPSQQSCSLCLSLVVASGPHQDGSPVEVLHQLSFPQLLQEEHPLLDLLEEGADGGLLPEVLGAEDV